jgi:hypothetical protein
MVTKKTKPRINWTTTKTKNPQINKKRKITPSLTIEHVPELSVGLATDTGPDTGTDTGPDTGTDTGTRVVRICRKNGVITQNCDIYIGRACNKGGWNLAQSKWHNPFTVYNVGSVEKAISLYESYIRGNPELLKQLPELQNRVLGCWCKNKPNDPCHGDVLVRLVNELVISKLASSSSSSS